MSLARAVTCTSLAAALLMTGCTSTPHHKGRTDLDSRSQRTVGVSVHGENRFVVEVAKGDFSSAGSITVADSGTDSPLPRNFVAAGKPKDITVVGHLAQPLTLSFHGAPDPDRVPVILHFDGSGWNVVGVAAGPAADVRVDRSDFSPYLPGWLDLKADAESFGNGVKDWATDGTEAPSCSGAAPAWASFAPATLDILKGCVGAGSKGVAIKAKNNRGLVYDINLGSDPSHEGTIADEPTVVRELINRIVGHQIAVLPPGGEVSFDLKRPSSTDTLELNPTLSPFSLAVSLIGAATGYPRNPEGVKVIAAVLDRTECVGLRHTISSGVLPHSLPGVSDFLSNVVSCLGTVLTDPKIVTQLAYQIVSWETGASVDDLKADASKNAQVEARGGKLIEIGEVVKSLLLFKEATTLYRAIGEELGRGLNSSGVDPGVMSVTLNVQTQGPAPLPAFAEDQSSAQALHAFLLKYPRLGVLFKTTYDDGSCQYLDVHGAELAKGNLDVTAGQSGDSGCAGDPAATLYRIRNGKVLARESTGSSGCGDHGVVCLFKRLYGKRRSSTFSAVDVIYDTDALYSVVIAPGDVFATGPQSFVPFVGGWGGHTRGLTIYPNGFAVESVGDGCCDPVIDLTFQLSTVSHSGSTYRSTVTITSVDAHPGWTSGGDPVPQVGQTFELSLSNGVIEEPLVNTNYCDDSQQNVGTCGA